MFLIQVPCPISTNWNGGEWAAEPQPRQKTSNYRSLKVQIVPISRLQRSMTMNFLNIFLMQPALPAAMLRREELGRLMTELRFWGIGGSNITERSNLGAQVAGI